MPDGLPSNLYSGGAVVFNSLPYTQYYLQSQARKRAKDEALTKYFADFTKSVNPAGMRTQDINEGWMQKRNDWEKFYMDNADKIKNVKLDNGKAYGEFMGRYQDLLNDTQISKNEVETRKQMLPIIADPDKRERLTEGFLGNLHASDYSIYDKRHRHLDISNIEFNPKPTDANTMKGWRDYISGDIKMDEGLPKVSVDPKTKSKISVTKSAFSNESINSMAGKAEALYNTDPRFMRFIDSELSNPQEHERLNKVFKETYGHDIDIQHPEEMAVAWHLDGLQKELTKTALQTYSPTTNFSFVNMMYKQGLLDAQSQQDFSTLQNVVNSKIQNGKRIPVNLGNGKTMDGTILNYTPAELEKFGKGINRVILYDDGQVVGYSMPSAGVHKDIPIKRYPLTQADLYMNVGKDLNIGKDLLDAMKYMNQQQPEAQQQINIPKQTQNKTYNYKGKPYTHSDLKKLGYTDEQIEQAVKMGNLK